jgi:hypothetical protein
MSYPFRKLFGEYALQLAIHKQKNQLLQPILCPLARTIVELGFHLRRVRHSLLWTNLSGTPTIQGKQENSGQTEVTVI